MAGGRGRDISISLSTDLDRFDTRQAERELAELGDAAQDAGRQLGDLEDDARQAGRGFDALGDGADRARHETDTAMDGVRDSARGAASELGGSFTGSIDDVSGALQGMMAEFGASLGPAGMAAAVAGAAAIGAAMAGWAEETERYDEQVQGLLDTFRRLGSVADIGLDDLKDFVDGMDSDTLKRASDDATKLGVSVQDVASAWAGDADAIALVTDASRRYYDEQGALRELNDDLAVRFGVNSDSMLSSTRALSSETLKLSDAELDAAESAGIAQAALGGLSQAQADLNAAASESIAEVATAADDLSGAMASLPDGILASAQAAADASSDMSDTLTDNLANVDGAFQEIQQRQLDDIAKTREYYANLESAYGSGNTDLVNWILEQSDPAEAAKLVTMMTPEQQQQIATNYATAGTLSSEALIKAQEAAFKGADKPAADAGKRAGNAYVDAQAKAIRDGNAKINNAAKSNYTTYNPWVSGTSKVVP